MRTDVAKMLAEPGIYLCGDTAHPEATIVLASTGVKILGLAPNVELRPDGFLATAYFEGPFKLTGGVKPDLSEGGVPPLVATLMALNSVMRALDDACNSYVTVKGPNAVLVTRERIEAWQAALKDAEKITLTLEG